MVWNSLLLQAQGGNPSLDQDAGFASESATIPRPKTSAIQLPASAQRSIRAWAKGAGTTLGASSGSPTIRSEEHTSELQSLMRISYAVFCLKKKKIQNKNTNQQLS